MIGSEGSDAGELARTHPTLTDDQTGLANSLHFDLVYNYFFLAGDRGLTLAVMLVSAGVGESAPMGQIRTIGKAIERTTRTSDLVSHMGSGRYVVLLVGTNLPGGRIAADRIELALADLAPGTISLGLAAYADAFKGDPQALLRSADTALLAAEAMGGGVEFA